MPHVKDIGVAVNCTTHQYHSFSRLAYLYMVVLYRTYSKTIVAKSLKLLLKSINDFERSSINYFVSSFERMKNPIHYYSFRNG